MLGVNPSDHSHVLVFTIALNGYQWLYAKHIQSQRNYARKWGYHYLAIERPTFSRLGVECCWLKLCVMKAALEKGYHKVLFVDADAQIQPDAPAIDNIIDDDKQIGMAKGYSGRFNSGVILAKRHPTTFAWLEQVLATRGAPVAESDSVGWGENGHIIQVSKTFTCIQELSTRWNNTFDRELNDYIRHFNHGPMRRSVAITLTHKLLSRVTHIVHWAESRFGQLRSQPTSCDDGLNRLFQYTLFYYGKILSCQLNHAEQ